MKNSFWKTETSSVNFNRGVTVNFDEIFVVKVEWFDFFFFLSERQTCAQHHLLSLLNPHKILIISISCSALAFVGHLYLFLFYTTPDLILLTRILNGNSFSIIRFNNKSFTYVHFMKFYGGFIVMHRIYHKRVNNRNTLSFITTFSGHPHVCCPKAACKCVSYNNFVWSCNF